MLHEALKFRLEFNNRLDIRSDIDVIVVGLGCCLKATEYRTSIGVGTVNDNHLGEQQGKKGFYVNVCLAGKDQVGKKGKSKYKFRLRRGWRGKFVSLSFIKVIKWEDRNEKNLILYMPSCIQNDSAFPATRPPDGSKVALS
jgi:hypothetical protein